MVDWGEVPVFGMRPADEVCVIRPSAYVLIEDEQGRLAVVRTVQGTYLPGGGIEAGETPEEAIRREALEECGLIVRPGAWVLRAVQFAYSYSERTYFEKRSTFVDGAIEGADASLLEADHEVLWVPAGTAAPMLAHQSHGWAIERWRRRPAG